MTQTIGNLLDAPSGIIVQGCNAQGVMGSGVAKAIRDAWPQVFTAYRQAYDQRGLRLGEVIWVKVKDEPLLMTANAITQEFYGREEGRVYVDYPAIEKAFTLIGQKARQYGLVVHYPLIGAGLGGGDWDRIEPIIERALVGVDHRLWLQPGPAARPGPR